MWEDDAGVGDLDLDDILDDEDIDFTELELIDAEDLQHVPY